MQRTIPTAVFCWLFLLAQTHGQDVFVPRELRAIPIKQPEKEHEPKIEKPASVKEPAVKESASSARTEKVQSTKTEPDKAPVAKESATSKRTEKVRSVKAESAKTPVAKESATNKRTEKIQSVKAEPDKAPVVQEPAANPSSEKVRSAKGETGKIEIVKESTTDRHADEIQSVRAGPLKEPASKGSAEKSRLGKIQTVRIEPDRVAATEEPAPDSDSEKKPLKTGSVKTVAVKESDSNQPLEKTKSVRSGAMNTPAGTDSTANQSLEKIHSVKAGSAKARAEQERVVESPTEKKTAKSESARVAVLKEPQNPRSEKIQPVKTESGNTPTTKERAANSQEEKVLTAKVDPPKVAPVPEPTLEVQLLNRSMETASTRLADGFDFPVGKPEAEGYYKARGFRSGGHVGEDWDGIRGGDTDFKDPIYCIGDGIVVFARDVHRGWGNVVIVRHAFRESGSVKHIDSLYGHLNSILVHRGQKVGRGQQIGTMGTAHGQYDAHLHFEVRKNLEIGMSRAKFQRNLSNYYDPSQFIASHRQLSGGGANFRVAMNTFTHDWAYRFDDARNFSPRKQSTAQSSAALRQALSSGTR